MGVLKFTITVLLAVISTKSELTYNKGADEGSDTSIPCFDNTESPIQDRQVIWWQTQGQNIGSYTKEHGFEPGPHPDFQGKFNITSLQGDLLAYDLNKTTDSLVYSCFITLSDGTNVTNTTDVKLEIGNYPNEFHIYTNRAYEHGCHEQEGKYKVTCTVLSDPKVQITWELDSKAIENGNECQAAVNESGTTCIEHPGEMYNCSYIFSPLALCHGIYTCRVDYELGDDVRLSDEGCVRVIRGPLSTFWFGLTIFAILAVITILTCIILTACGLITFSCCTHSPFYIKCLNCQKKEINPASELTNTAYDSGCMYIVQNLNVAEKDDPPPYKE